MFKGSGNRIKYQNGIIRSSGSKTPQLETPTDNNLPTNSKVKKSGDKLRFFVSFYPPKSSKATFSGGTPQSSHILITAWFIIGGPQK